MLKSQGPKNAKIVIVVDTGSTTAFTRGEVLNDSVGAELGKMLHEAGLLRSEIYQTAVFKELPLYGDLDNEWNKKKPLDNSKVVQAISDLREEIRTINPNIVITLGDLSLFALTGETSTATWRGSELTSPYIPGLKVIPTYAVDKIFVMWEWRSIAVQDLRRAAREAEYPGVFQPPWKFKLRPSFTDAMETLQNLIDRADKVEGPLYLAVDIETRGGYMACCGIGWSRHEAICIPFMCIERPEGYFSPEEEFDITLRLEKLLTHPKVCCVGQNFAYDAQYFAKEHGYVPRLTDDTMVLQGTLWPGMSKGLDFIASLYCENYTYWKSEGKEWNANIPEDQLWSYNCKDCCYTLEAFFVLSEAVRSADLREVYLFQMKLWYAVFRMMLRGVAIDKQARARLTNELFEAMTERQERLNYLCGQELNINSPKQISTFFYEDLRQPVQRQKKTHRPSTDDACLKAISTREPLLKCITDLLSEMRSIGVFLSTFVKAPLDSDGRMRCYFNIVGTETFRFSSSENAFGSGTNLQNIPKGDEDEEHREDQYTLPNIRKLFIPDPGYLIFDVDLAGADAQVVAWEADDRPLKDAFIAYNSGKGPKVHCVNAIAIYGEATAGENGKREPYYSRAKMGVHLTNYGGKARTCAIALNMPIADAERFQRLWFNLHPQILDWHHRTQESLNTTRSVRNQFGYRRVYFDRVENLLPEALAWVPQSTVACVINRALERIDREIPKALLLLQVHDSLVGQCKISDWPYVKPLLREALRVTIPYPDDPLVIDASLKTSAKSWGDCESEAWE